MSLQIGCDVLIQRAARVIPLANVEVAPPKVRISLHPRIRNPGHISATLKKREVNADFPGGYRPAGCGNGNPNEMLLMVWGSWKQHASRAVSRDNAEIPPNSGRIISHRRVETSCLPLRL